MIGEGGRETAVGHPVVESDSAATPASGSSEGTTEVFFSRDEPSGAVAAGGQSAADVDATAAAAVSQPEPDPKPQPAAAPPVDSGGTSPAAADRQAADSTQTFEEKPELFVAGAFVGAFVLAKILKKLTAGGED